jgi:hypothetical protein
MTTVLEQHAAEIAIEDSLARRGPFFVRRWAGSLRRALTTDAHLPTVLAVWALAALLLGLLTYRYALPFPWWNEWDLMVPVAAGQEPASLDWLGQLRDGQRLPLTRLFVLVLGQMTGWNTRLIHLANLALLALAALALIRAVRRVRGQSSWSDMFLALLVLSPWQYETVLWACVGMALPLALFGLAVSVLLTNWPLRSTTRLAMYLALVLAVSLSAGPVANLWTAGLCGVVVRGWLGGRPRGWCWFGLVGAAAVLGISVAVNGSPWVTTIAAAAPMAVGWLGPDQALLGSWALLVLALPGLYLVVRVLGECKRSGETRMIQATDLRAWGDLLIPLGAVLTVAVVAVSARYGSGNPWDSHFSSLLVPIGLMLYVLLVRVRAPQVIPGALALLMAVSVGWSWRGSIGMAQLVHGGMVGPAALLQKGQEPLSLWVANNNQCVGYANQKQLLEYLLQMRRACCFVFRKEAPEPVPGMGPPLVLRAAAGDLRGNFRAVEDAKATGNQAVLAGPGIAGLGTVAFNIEVPAAGMYGLCCRLHVPDDGHTLTVQVDGGPAVANPLCPAPEYSPYLLAPVSLTPGKHLLALQAARPGLRLDVVEIIPQCPQR